MTAIIGLVLVWISGLLAGQILFARPEIERTKDWEFLAEWWQEKYWEEFRKHNDDERFNVTVYSSDFTTAGTVSGDTGTTSTNYLNSIVPEYENQR